ITRTDVPALGVLGALALAPFMLSPFVLATGWIGLYRPGAGFMNLWVLEPLFGATVDVYSWWGIAAALASFLAPIAYLFVASSMQAFDGTLEEASHMAGAGLWRTFRKVSLPLVAPAIAGVALLIFVTAMEMFSIPGLLGRPIGVENIAV